MYPHAKTAKKYFTPKTPKFQVRVGREISGKSRSGFRLKGEALVTKGGGGCNSEKILSVTRSESAQYEA